MLTNTIFYFGLKISDSNMFNPKLGSYVHRAKHIFRKLENTYFFVTVYKYTGCTLSRYMGRGYNWLSQNYFMVVITLLLYSLFFIFLFFLINTLILRYNRNVLKDFCLFWNFKLQISIFIL